MQERLFQTPLRKTRLCTMIEYPGVVYERLILWNIDEKPKENQFLFEKDDKDLLV